MSLCPYCNEETLTEHNEHSDDKWNYSIGYCELCGVWWDIQTCFNCQHTTFTGMVNKKLIKEFEEEYFE